MKEWRIKMNTKKILFSVLMSVYKKDNDSYFEAALKSISIDQTLLPNQIVLVVDGPINIEKEIIINHYKSFAGFRFDILRLPCNVGQGMALNKGLEVVQFEYVARMDSDDISLPIRFERQIEYLNNNPEVDVLSSLVEEFDEDGHETIRSIPLGFNDVKKYAKLRSPVNHGACIYKKNKVIAVGGYDRYVQLQDYLLFVKMIVAGYKICNTNDVVLKVRLQDGYSRKSGLNYFMEEINLALEFYRLKFIGFFGLIRNLILRALPRLMPSYILDLMYRRILRRLL